MNDVRTACGNGLISYHPEWGSSKPFQVFHKGEHFNSSNDIQDAFAMLVAKGCSPECEGKELLNFQNMASHHVINVILAERD